MADRISALHDDLLRHVLSFLRAHEAVRTCMLARRWRHLWKSAPAVRVTGVKGCIDPEWFFNFVDSLLLLRDPVAGLDSFELDLDYDDFDFDLIEFMPANELHVNTLIQHALRDLKLCPTFSKLKTLLLSKWCPGIASDLNILSCFLKHSPILEKLTLQLSEEPKVPVKTQRSYTPSKQSFAFTHLKIVEIKCDKVGGRSHKVLDILSTFDIPLEKVTIQQGN
ncbi:hypothetical protein ZWY2020_007321 [Hordeum vulgare]|nr:hypothetical protein ZWY2020_007321 [Hordeum vulgare]